MNIQPLEIYGEDASFGGGLKLLNRYYDDALIKVIRHNDSVSADVYPDQDGKVSLYSQIAVGSLYSSATTLGAFLNYPGFVNDAQVLGQSITAGVSIIYDQSPNQNNATNSDPNTQFLIAVNSEVFFGEYGLELYTLDKHMTIGSVGQSFSLHLTYTPINETQNNPQAIIKQEDNAFAFNSRNQLAFIIGQGLYTRFDISTVTNQDGGALVLIDEDYFSNYTGTGITLESSTAKILTIESKSTDAAYDSTANYVLGGANGAFYTCIVYVGNGFKTRRHRTNQIMAEDIENLSSQLTKFSPESFYNHFYNASAIFATVSLSGVNNLEEKKLLRVLRSTINDASSTGIRPELNSWAVEVDVYTDNSGRLSLESPIQNSNKPTSATKLGEFLNATGYNNVDNIPDNVWGFTHTWYDQSLHERQAVKFSSLYPILYNGNLQRFEPAVGDETIVKAMNFDYGNVFQSYFKLDENNFIASPKSIVIVYANNGVTNKYSQLAGWSFGGPGYYSRIPRITEGEQVVKGFSIDEGIAVTNPFGAQFTDYGLDTKTHIVGISLGENPQFIVDNNDPVEFDIYTNNELFEPLEFNVIGPMYGYIQAIIVYDDDKLSDFPEIFAVLQGFFGVEDSIFPETDLFEDIPHVYKDVTHIYSLQKLADLSTFLATIKVDTTGLEFPALGGVITKELFNKDVQALAEDNDARLLTLYNQIKLADTPFNANEATTLIKIYDGATEAMVRLSSPNKIVIDPTAVNQRFTSDTSISLPNDSCIYLIGKYPSTDGTLVGNGSTKIGIAGASFIVTTSAGSYSFPSGLSVNDFFVFRMDRLGTSLIAQTNKNTIYEYEITSAETLEFNTLLTNGSSDVSQYTGGFYGAIVFNKSKRLVGQDITTTIYENYNLTAPDDASNTTVLLGSYPVIESTTLAEGTNNTDTTFVETVTNPLGLETGNMLLAVVMADSGSAGPLNTTPTGWTLISNPTYTGQGAISILYKIVDGTEGSTSDFELYRNQTYNPILYYNIWMARVTGVNTTTPINVTGSTSTSSSTPLTISGITTTSASTLAIAAALFDGSDGDPLSAAVDWTEEAVLDNPDDINAQGFAGIIASKEISAASAVSDLEITANIVSDGMVGIMFAINPQ